MSSGISKSKQSGFQAGINGIDANVAVINREWEIVAANIQWEEFGRANGYKQYMNGSSKSENYLSVLKQAIRDGEDTALKALLGISSVMNRETDFFELEYPCHSPEGEKRWFNMHVTYIDDLDLVLLRHINSTKQRTTVRTLEETESRLHQLFNHSLEGILMMDQSGRIIDANPRASAILKYKSDEILRETKKGIFDQLDESTLNWIHMIFSGENVSTELKMKQKTGESIVVELSASRILSEDGNMLITIIFHDITRRKLYESDLAAEKRFIDSAINSLPGIFFVFDSNYKFIRWNRNFVRMIGYSDDELQDLHPLDLVHDEERVLLAGKLVEVFENGDVETGATIVTRDGECIPYHLTGTRFTVNGRMYLVGTGIDITSQRVLEQKNADLLELEREARNAADQSRNELEKMIRHAPSPICFLEGPELKIALINNAFKKILGRFKITGLPFKTIIEQIRGIVSYDEIEKVYLQGRAYIGEEVELEIVNPDEKTSRTYFFSFILQPVKDENNNVYGIFIQAMDVTSMVNSRIELKKSLQEQQVLIEEVHHRVKNNLAIITGLFELQIDQETDENTIEKLRDSQLRIYTMAAIHEMLYQNESLSQINFADYIRHMMEKIFHTINTDNTRIRWVTDLDPVIMSVNQAIPLGMILNELLTNVIKHAFNKKQAGNEHPGGLISVKLTEVDDEVCLSVGDNGIGYDWNIECNRNKLGVTLINLLSTQIGATINVDADAGTNVDILFAKDFQEMQVM